MDRKVLNGLFLGDLSLSKDEDFLVRNSITHILSALSEPLPHFSDLSYLCLELSDSPHQRIAPVFGECLEYIHRARASGGSVLVHCSTGVSRGPTIVAAYLLARTDLSVNEILQVVSAVRPCSNPNYGFRRQLEDWTQQHRKNYMERVKGWPEVKHDDEWQCSTLLALYNSGEKDNCSLGEGSACGADRESNSSIPDHADSRKSCSTIDSDSKEAPQLTMGNNGSATVDSPPAHGEVTGSSGTGRRRAKLFSPRQRKASRGEERIKKHFEDTENNNKLSSFDYTDRITRSTTLPNDINKVNGSTGSPFLASTLNGSATQTRFLPAYKFEEAGVVGDLAQRQRIASSPAYNSRSRHTSSQSSGQSRRHSTTHRSPAIHIPANPDKKLMRSRSVGVISAAQSRVHRAVSASVVKIDDCEDWIV